MKYRDKWSKVIVEAVKWDGNIETIKNNKWLYDALKENKIVSTTNYINNKEIILFKKVKDFFSDDENIREIKNNSYIIKEISNQDYKIRIMDSKSFEKMFEPIEENNNCILINLEVCGKEIFDNLANDLKEIKKKFEKKESLINNEKYKYKYSFKVVTKDMFIEDRIGLLDINTINHQWDKISKGYNFILFKEGINKINRYYSVNELNELFKR